MIGHSFHHGENWVNILGFPFSFFDNNPKNSSHTLSKTQGRQIAFFFSSKSKTYSFYTSYICNYFTTQLNKNRVFKKQVSFFITNFRTSSD